MHPMNVELVSWASFHRLARDLALRIRASNFQPDMIVAIARGGVVPARVLCDYPDIMDLT
jgi:hypoxanthine phosphoribosyltransferase